MPRAIIDDAPLRRMLMLDVDDYAPFFFCLFAFMAPLSLRDMLMLPPDAIYTQAGMLLCRCLIFAPLLFATPCYATPCAYIATLLLLVAFSLLLLYGAIYAMMLAARPLCCLLLLTLFLPARGRYFSLPRHALR